MWNGWTFTFGRLAPWCELAMSPGACRAWGFRSPLGLPGSATTPPPGPTPAPPIPSVGAVGYLAWAADVMGAAVLGERWEHLKTGTIL